MVGSVWLMGCWFEIVNYTVPKAILLLVADGQHAGAVGQAARRAPRQGGDALCISLHTVL